MNSREQTATFDNTPEQDSRSYCLTLHVEPLVLIVPRILVAEVMGLDGVNFSSSINRDIRIFEWRGYNVPLISGSVLNPSCKDVEVEDSKVVLLHGVLNHDKLPYYAVMVSRNPRLVQVSEDNIIAAEDDNLQAAELQKVLLEGEPAIIPKVDYLEKYIHDNCLQ